MTDETHSVTDPGERAISPGDEPGAPTHAARKPWKAVLLSFFTPGLGHVYAGAVKRGAVVWLICLIGALIAVGVAIGFPGFGGLVAALALLLVVGIFPAWDSVRVARRQSPHYVLRVYNRWYVYVGVMLISTFVWQPVFERMLRERLGNAYRLPSDSMAPTLLTGDRILASPIREPIARGQIVIHLWAGKPYIKRVVAVPGDTIAMLDGQLTIDGEEVREPYARREPEDPVVSEFEWQGSHLADSTARKTYQPSLHTWGPLVVPGEHYFVLGDNRNNSADSRYFGYIARDSIIARPTVVYFSSDPVTGTIRWDRIGYSAERPTVRRSAARP